MAYRGKLCELEKKDPEALAVISLDPDNFQEFEQKYNRAKKAGSKTFRFQGEDVPVEVAQHILTGLPEDARAFLHNDLSPNAIKRDKDDVIEDNDYFRAKMVTSTTVH